MIVLPLLVTWGIWLARNKLIFTGKVCAPTITAEMVCGIAHALPKHLQIKNQREVLALDIDRSTPWGFFDGASQNNLCGGCGILNLDDYHSFELIIGMGEGSNNHTELLSLHILLIFCSREGV